MKATNTRFSLARCDVNRIARLKLPVGPTPTSHIPFTWFHQFNISRVTSNIRHTFRLKVSFR